MNDIVGSLLPAAEDCTKVLVAGDRIGKEGDVVALNRATYAYSLYGHSDRGHRNTEAISMVTAAGGSTSYGQTTDDGRSVSRDEGIGAEAAQVIALAQGVDSERTAATATDCRRCDPL
jgi:hypothetical protein